MCTCEKQLKYTEMLKFFSASTRTVISKKAMSECLENALQGEPDLDCDLIIIHTGMGHNFNDLLTEAHRLSPKARITGCTGAGIIGKNGPDESLKALAIMVVKGPDTEFALTARSTKADTDSYTLCAEMAKELKENNPGINMILFLPQAFLMPTDKGIDGIKSVFGSNIAVFGGISMDNQKGVNCYGFFDSQVIEKGMVMAGFADPTLKYVSRVNHGFNVIEGLTFEVTKSVPGRIYELNGRPAWKVVTEALGIPETTSTVEVTPIAGLARELPAESWEEYGSKYILFVTMTKNDDNSINVSVTCREGTRLWLTKRDERKMFEGVDMMVKKILADLDGKRPVAVFHSDCVLRGRYSLNQVLKEDIISRLQTPLFADGRIPWLGMYSAGEIGMLNGEACLHQITSSLFVMCR